MFNQMAVNLSLTKEQAALLVPVLLQLGVGGTNQQSVNQLAADSSPTTPVPSQRFKSPDSSDHYQHTQARSTPSRKVSACYYSSAGNCSSSELESSSEFTPPMGKTCPYTVEDMLNKKARNSKSSRAQAYLLVREICYGVCFVVCVCLSPSYFLIF